MVRHARWTRRPFGDAALVVVGLGSETGLDRPLYRRGACAWPAHRSGSGTGSWPSTWRAASPAMRPSRWARRPSTRPSPLTFHRRKRAHVLEPARGLCGEVVVADIGLGRRTPTTLFENDPRPLAGGKFPWPVETAHKHARGRPIVVSGEAWRTGAARRAARSGLRVGAGLVQYVLSPPDALLVNAAHLEGDAGPLRDRAGTGAGRPARPRRR